MLQQLTVTRFEGSTSSPGPWSEAWLCVSSASARPLVASATEKVAALGSVQCTCRMSMYVRYSALKALRIGCSRIGAACLQPTQGCSASLGLTLQQSTACGCLHNKPLQLQCHLQLCCGNKSVVASRLPQGFLNHSLLILDIAWPSILQSATLTHDRPIASVH